MKLQAAAQVLLLSAFVAVPVATFGQIGHVMDGVGAINESMTGTSVALPIDPMGAQYANPATIGELPASTVALDFELFWPTIELSSSAGPFSGSTDSEFNLSVIPTLAAVFIDDEHKSPWAFGVGAYGVSGFGVDYPSDLTNPILAPQPLGGFGQIFSRYQLLQVYGTVSYELLDGLSLGIAPTLDVASLVVEPFPATPPGPAGYPNSDTAWSVGTGFQAGAYYHMDNGLSLGASLKSPQWFTHFDFNGSGGRDFSFNLDFPLIASGGIGFAVTKRLKIGADVRYLDYEHTDGFSESGFDPFGAVQGFGWKSIWAVSTGVQYLLTDTISLRAGYTYNQSPIDSDQVFFNVHAPAIIQHHLGVGASWRFSENWTASLAYTHGFENSVRGPMYSPLAPGPVPGTSVESTMSTDSVLIGISWEFGERKASAGDPNTAPAGVSPDAAPPASQG